MREVFAEEQSRLLALPELPFETHERIEVVVRKVPYARFDLNDYSVPHTRIDRTLTVVADLSTVRLLDGTEVIATHARSFDKGAQVEDPEHIDALRRHKKQARADSVLDYLHRAAPSVAELMLRVAERGGNIGSLTAHLHRLLDTHGATAIERAVAGALAQDLPHLGAIRQLLDMYRQQRGLPPPISSRLPDDPRVRELHVKPHDLDDYDQLTQEDKDDEDTTH